MTVQVPGSSCWKCGYDRAGVAGDAVCPECGAQNFAENPIDPRYAGVSRWRWINAGIVLAVFGIVILMLERCVGAS